MTVDFPFFKKGDKVQFGENWEWTGTVVHVLQTKNGPKYAVKYFVGRESRWKEFTINQLKLRIREVK